VTVDSDNAQPDRSEDARHLAPSTDPVTTWTAAASADPRRLRMTIKGARTGLAIGAAGLALAASLAPGLVAAGDATAGPAPQRLAAASDGPAHRNGPIVFQRLDPHSGKTRLYTIRPDGSGLRAITLPGPNADKDSLPEWSPDGRRILFRRFFNPGQPNETSDVLVVRPDGTGLRNLTRQSCTGDCLSSDHTAWSPDGRRVAFERAVGPLPAAGPPPIVGIFVMNADGSNVRQLTQLEPNSGTEDHVPTWSPDGRRIAFMRVNNTINPVNASAIYTIKPDGSDLRLVRRMPREWPGAGAPDWSPDGSRLLFQTYCRKGNCGQPAAGAQLFTIDPDGGRLRQLTHLPGNSYDAGWSPDGKKIVLARNRAVGPEGDIYTINADGTNLRRLTHAPELDAHMPDWGPALGRRQPARDRARPITTLQGGVLAPVSARRPGNG
jgi:Tol biopolymer transport system component